MNTIRPLRGNQSDYGGSGACAAIACALAAHMLADPEFGMVGMKAAMARIEAVMQQAAIEWNAQQAGFLTAAEVLERFSTIGERLRIESEVASDITGPLLDGMGCEIVPSVRDTLLAWMQDAARRTSTACVVTRGGYTFLLCYAKPYYFIVDSHANTVSRHESSLLRLDAASEEELHTSAGIVIRTRQYAQVLNWVLEYAPHDANDRSEALTSSNQVDFVFLALSLNN